MREVDIFNDGTCWYWSVQKGGYVNLLAVRVLSITTQIALSPIFPGR